tara:strand:- start:3283 stop:4512 length:1230 start_codon:yes stop_codon:yes gene_type:complete
MFDIRPFKGTRPYSVEAENLIAPSTDHLTEEGIIDIFEKSYWNYLKILNPVGKTKEKESLKAAKKHFSEMKTNNIIKKDIKSCFYIYQIKTSTHIQIGFLAIANIEMFIKNNIKGHELTYEKRTQERADQMLNLDTQIGPIYLFYEDYSELDDLLFQHTFKESNYDFMSFDNSRHTLWCIDDSIEIDELYNSINKLKIFYIADGHHRISAIKKIYEYKSSKNYKNNSINEYKHFMFSAFPKSKTKIYDYNRVVRDLNSLSVKNFLDKIEKNFIYSTSSTPVKPKKNREFGMYHDNKWYLLKFKNEKIINNDILSKLDINILNNFCLKPVLGIQNLNNDERIRFIAGSHGLKALEKKVNDNPDSVAFSIFATEIDSVIEVANNKLTMPPKSTWFDPKPLDGLVVYEFNQK